MFNYIPYIFNYVTLPLKRPDKSEISKTRVDGSMLLAGIVTDKSEISRTQVDESKVDCIMVLIAKAEEEKERGSSYISQLLYPQGASRTRLYSITEIIKTLRRLKNCKRTVERP